MQASLSSLAQWCAESGVDIAGEDLGPHWGLAVAAVLAQALPIELRADRLLALSDEPAAPGERPDGHIPRPG